MADTPVRCFIAIEIPVHVQRELHLLVMRLKERVRSADVRWVATANIHLTLKFLGDVPAARIDHVRAALEATCAAAAPIHLGITSPGMFTTRGTPRVVWVGIGGELTRLAALATALDESLGRLGFARENRPFAPHLTVARVRPEAGDSATAALSVAVSDAATGSSSFEASEVSLMRSQLTPGGAIYTRMAGATLRDRAASG